MSEASGSVTSRLNALLTAAGLDTVDSALGLRFEAYLSLLLRWNARINLTSVRDEDGILSRHFVESIACASSLPAGIATLLDFGSGAGFPGIPIALCRRKVAVTLAESQGKRAAFLREAVRTLGISATVHSGRAETLCTKFDCATLRAVERMSQAVATASRLVASKGWLALMTTRGELAALQIAAGADWQWRKESPLPGSTDRLLALAQRRISSPA